MFISDMIVENYRTFEKISFSFDSRANYIVGDNNIGKSNFLDLLKTMTHAYGFREKDFLDTNIPIRILFTLSTADTGRKRTIHMELRQSVEEVVPHLFNRDTGEEHPLSYMRSLFYVPYAFSDVPRSMVTEEEMRKMEHMLFTYFSEGESAREEVRRLLRPRGIDFDISGGAEKAARRLLHEIFSSPERKGAGTDTMRLMLAVGAHLLLQLSEMKNSKSVPLNNIVMTDDGGRRLFPLMVSIDEPEIHLHPYLQRAVLAFCGTILNNEDPFFLKLVQKILDVDGLDGQLFVVTHSTDALVNDYRKIIRLYYDQNNEVSAACGSTFRFTTEVEKHLIMHFPEIKEALYARSVILVEGETEFGAFPYFAKAMGIHFDYHGICLLNARGESSIGKIATLIRRFRIPAVLLYDKDVQTGKVSSASTFYTDEVCFEMDVVKSCIRAKRRDILDKAVAELTEETEYVNSQALKKGHQKLGIARRGASPKKLSSLSNRAIKAMEVYYFSWFYSQKGVMVGRAIGRHMPAPVIPSAFRKVITQAVIYADGEKQT